MQVAVPAGERGESLARRGGGVPLAVAVPVLETEGLPRHPLPSASTLGLGRGTLSSPQGCCYVILAKG